jgi:hypothetical protein
VLEASRGRLELYVDVHQNGRQKDIEVATVEISSQEARAIKKVYRDIRDPTLKNVSNVASVDLLIEPIDGVEIGAWAAKDYLSSMGLSPERFSTVGYGKKLPRCREQSEKCFQKNRRDRFVLIGSGSVV